jgi:hypothetical protein
LIVHQDVKLKIIRGIYWDEGINDNDFIISNLLVKKYSTDDENEIKNIKNDINYIHRLLLMKDKLKKYIKNKNEFDSFLDYNEPILFGYYKRKNDNNYNVYLRKTIDLNYTNVLFGVQIRSMAKSIMNKYFKYCDDNNIKIFYCNTDSIIIREKDLNKMDGFIDKNKIGFLKIDGIYECYSIIESQGKYEFLRSDKNKIRNMNEI